MVNYSYPYMFYLFVPFIFIIIFEIVLNNKRKYDKNYNIQNIILNYTITKMIYSTILISYQLNDY